MDSGLAAALRAGAIYFAVVFAAGFALGVVRVLLLAPSLGATAAVLAEVPVMLALSWLACGSILRRIDVPPSLGARLAMGGYAFVLLIGAEMALASGPRAWLATIGAPPGAIGLAAQIVFALLPALRSRG